MSAIFDFSSLLTVLVLSICTCSYLRELRPTIFDGAKVREKWIVKEGMFVVGRAWYLTVFGFPLHDASTPISFIQPRDPNKPIHADRDGLGGFCWKLSRIGERLSPFISVGCLLMAIHVLFLK
jgi:hypothetical protein